MSGSLEIVLEFYVDLAGQCYLCAVQQGCIFPTSRGQLLLTQSSLLSEARLKDQPVTVQALKNRA